MASDSCFFRFHLPEHGQQRLSHEEISARLWESNRGGAEEVKLLIGFCLMLRRSALERVGLLDEDLFLGSDDLELCWRLRLQGFGLQIATDAYVEHKGSTSFNTLPSETTRCLLEESTRVLVRKLEAHYGAGKVPTSRELWGLDIFR